MTQDTRTPIGYIYKIHCTLPEVSGVYIGKTTRTIKQRFKQHCGKTGSNSKIGKAIQLYGPQNFVVTELAVAYTQDDLSDLERNFIREYDSIEHGFNVAKGGQGVIPSPRLLRKWQVHSYKNKPVIHYETGIQYISGTEAARALGLSSTDITECCRMHLCQSKGNHFYYPGADLEKCKAYWRSAVRRRPVVCMETGEVFKGIKDACVKTGISRDVIAGMCKGQVAHTRSALHFYFADITQGELAALKTKWAAKPEYSWGKRVLDTETGIVYASIAEASRIIGVSNKKIKRHDRYEFVK